MANFKKKPTVKELANVAMEHNKKITEFLNALYVNGKIFTKLTLL